MFGISAFKTKPSLKISPLMNHAPTKIGTKNKQHTLMISFIISVVLITNKIAPLKWRSTLICFPTKTVACKMAKIMKSL